MDNKLIVEKIESLILKFRDLKEDKIHNYTTIAVLSDKIKEKNQDSPNIEIYLSELSWNCESLAGIDYGNGHSEEEHISWALGVLGKIKSSHCLNIK